MTTLEKLREENPEMMIHTVSDVEFRKYGRWIREIDVSGIRKTVLDMAEMPENGSRYTASAEWLEPCAGIKKINEERWGGYPAQAGLCWGHSNQLNALEWHACNEINIAVTDLVLMLSDVGNIGKNGLSSDAVEIFYLEKGTMVELYSSTLHFCPCEVFTSGFFCVVSLPLGTNTPLEPGEKGSRYLFSRNKWLIAHEENAGLIARGAVGDLHGINLRLNPVE